MLDRMRSRVEELQGRGLEPVDALIVASVELGDSVEQIASRLGITRQTLHAALRRGQGIS
jgi:transcriptional regulator of acetoin/glycerol metabolism